MIVTRAVTLSKQVMGVVVQSLNYCPVTFLGSVTFFVTPIQRLQNKCSVGPVLGAVGDAHLHPALGVGNATNSAADV